MNSSSGSPWYEQDVSLGAIDISAQNTRKDLSAGEEDASLEDLARSIQAHGLLQPPLLRPTRDGRHEVIAGQRRILACRKLGLATIPARITHIDDSEAVMVSLIENVQRADMCPLDKSALDRLFRVHGCIGRVSQ